jgi:phage terminase large subunit-like protein
MTSTRRLREKAYRRLLKLSFRDFWDEFWPKIEPTREQMPSVAVDAICAALQAVADGRIKRLAIECPPGVGKSKLGPVAFPAWMLYRTNGQARVMAGSYTQPFAERDSMFCRDIIESPEYTELVGGAWELREDANSKNDYHTTTAGRRLIASITGKATGERCTVQLLDDVLNAIDATSPAKKREARRWVNDVLPSRLEDQRSDARVIIGQPLAVDDPIADVLRKGWKHLRLPVVRREDEAPCVLLDDQGVEVWRDTRAIGQPLLDLLNDEGIANLRGDISPGAYATQYELRRGDDSSATFKRTWWRWYYARSQDAAAPRPAHTDAALPSVPMPSHFSRTAITADLTFGSLTGDYASVQAWGESGPDLYLLAARRGRVGFDSSLEWMLDFSARFPNAVVGVEKAANGHAVLEKIKKQIRGVKALKPWGKKQQRHAAATPTAAGGSCYLPLGAVFEEVDEEGTVERVDASEFVEELAGATQHDDQMDAASYAIIELTSGVARPLPQGGTRGTADTAVTAPPPATPSIWAAIGGTRGR